MLIEKKWKILINFFVWKSFMNDEVIAVISKYYLYILLHDLDY